MRNTLFYDNGKDEVIVTPEYLFTQKYQVAGNIEMYGNTDITLVKGRLEVIYNTNSHVVPAEDGLAKLIQTIHFNVAYRDLYACSLQQLVLYNYHIQGKSNFSLRNDQPSVVPNQKNVRGYVDFFFSPTLRPDNPKEGNVKFCSKNLSSGTSVSAVWGYDGCLGEGYDVLSATNLEVTEQYGWTNDNIPYTKGYSKPTATEYTVLSPYLQYGYHPLKHYRDNKTDTYNINIPYDKTIRNILLIAKNDKGVRDNSIIDTISIVQINGRYISTPISFVETQIESGISPKRGCLLLGFKEGLYLNSYGDAIIQITFTKQGSIEYLMDTLIPVVMA